MSDDITREWLELVLQDVEHPSLRKVLESLVRQGKMQRACILKDFYQKAPSGD